MIGSPQTAWIRAAASKAADPGEWWRFEDPVEALEAAEPQGLFALFERLEEARQEGLWAVGWVAYEAAPALDPALAVRTSANESIAAFGLFRPPTFGIPAPAEAIALPDLEADLGESAYSRAVAEIRGAIAAGETYQVNFTFPMKARYDEAPERLFSKLAATSRAPYAAFLDCGERAVISLSPELFFELEGDLLTMRPMKGTRARGRFLEEDRRRAEELATSPKERAENLMIVDMVRNDLGRLARPGSVAVERLFALERYPTVWQMTSTVSARTDAGLLEIFRGLFPCASVTGAPKSRTMQWISRLEAGARGVYCGAIGWAAPGRKARFSVAIRTAVVDRARRTLEYGVGSGVVWDSTPAAEYAECLTKARAIGAPPSTFSLIETMLWQHRGGVRWLECHLRRLAQSADHFDIPVEVEEWRRAIFAAIGEVSTLSSKRLKLRCELRADGAFRVVSSEEPRARRLWRVRLAESPVDSADARLFHKTSDRTLYEAAGAEARAAGADEAILWNERGELTEGTRTNLVLDLDGSWVTPSRESGLLAGVCRQVLLDRRRIREAVLRKNDLGRAQAIYLTNSLRGLMRAVLDDRPKPAREAG